MFGDLPKLLDREFLFGFFLPAVLFVAATLLLGVHFEIVPLAAVLDFAIDNPTLGTVIAVLAVWFVAGFLLALNSLILRTKEGYCWWQGLVFVPLTRLQKAVFRRVNQVLNELNEAAAGHGEKVPPQISKARIQRAQQLATEFPHEESQILPFSFGNVLRAFEAYPLVMYDLDPIASWSRLWMVMPQDSRQLVDAAKSQVDFMLNLWAAWWALLVEYAVLAWLTGSYSLRWFPAVAAAGILACSRLATGAAVRWGDRVKAAFDVYLPVLRRDLDLAAAPTFDQEREVWDRLSQALLFRDLEALRLARAAAASGSGPRRLPRGPASVGSAAGHTSPGS